MNRRDLQIERNKGHVRRLLPFLLLSALLWLLFLHALPHILPKPPEPEALKPIAMKTIKPDKWMENKSIKARSKPHEVKVERKKKLEKEKEKEKPKEPEKPEGQIVDIAMPEKEEKPLVSKFVSQYDSKVKKQTKAKHRAPMENVTKKLKKTGIKKPKQKTGRKKNELVIADNKPERKKKGGEAKEAKLLVPEKKKKMELKFDLDERLGEMRNRLGEKETLKGKGDKLAMVFKEKSEGQADEEQKGKRSNIPKELLPSLQTTLDIAGAPMNDHLPDIEESDETSLNTRSFKYATFYNRVKRRVSQRWDPVSAQRRYDPTLAIYGYGNRLTVLKVTLDKHGNLITTAVKQSSGVDFLDQAAISAVSDAAPFPNPPTGIVEQDGTIRFPFGFFFELTKSGFNITGYGR